MRIINQITEITEKIHRERFPQARVVFLAGSIVRHEGTATSDLDLVVVFNELKNAYRDSFYFEKWPVEAFVHDPQTLEYFFRSDCNSGCPSLPSMVCEGIEIPGSNDFSSSLKKLASEYLAKGPPEWKENEVASSRYFISDMIDDLRDPRNAAEMNATAASLYGVLANHFFRSKKLWSAKGKSIPRKLLKADPGIAKQFIEAFDRLFKDGDTRQLFQLAEDILKPSGGFLFDSYKIEAPADWRISD